MKKFGRIYRLRYILADSEIVVELPLTVEFNIERTAMATLNTATFSIYNLSEENQRKIFKDRYRLGFDRKQVIFEAGYEDTLTRIFVGDVFQAYTVREGIDAKTTIVCRTGYSDITTTRIDKSFSAGITLFELYDEIINLFPNLERGAIGGENTTFNRPVSIEGNAYNAIKTYSRNAVFIDNDLVNVVEFGEALDNAVYILSPETGLLNTPTREEIYITAETLFEPRPSMNGIVEIDSSTAPVYNGQYKVIGATHTGVISGAVAGTLTSKFNLISGATQGEFKVIGTR
jgi:hypothetical protein